MDGAPVWVCYGESETPPGSGWWNKSEDRFGKHTWKCEKTETRPTAPGRRLVVLRQGSEFDGTKCEKVARADAPHPEAGGKCAVDEMMWCDG